MTSETMNKINIGAEIVDVVFKALGIPLSVSSKIKLIENVMSAGKTDPKIQLRNNIADSIDKIVRESNISDVDVEAVKDNVAKSLEKVTKQDYIDNISSPQSLINDIINNHTDFGGAAEECYQSIIKSVVNALCTNNNIAVFVNEGLMLAKILSQNNKIQSSITDFNDALNELIEYFREKFLLKSEIKIENTDNAFSYSNSKVGFYGRGAEVNKIDEFMNCDKPFTFWSITGYGGMGKSKLAYNIAKKYDKQNWTVIWYDSNNTDIDKIFGKDFVHNVLFIVDYAGSKIDAVRKIITKSIAKTKNQDENRIIHIRLLMVERDDYSKNGSMNYSAIETWYQNIFNCQDFDGKKNFEYKNEPNKSNKPLNLSAINDTEALYNIIDDFTVNVKGEQKLDNSKKDEIIDFVRNKLCRTEKDSHFADRCIFILFTTDAVLSGKDIKNWDTAKLLKNYINRLEVVYPDVKKIPNFKLLIALATAVGGINIYECDDKVFKSYINGFKDYFSNDYRRIRSAIKTLFEKNIGDTVIIPLQPDLVGEYYFINEMRSYDDINKSFLKTFLSTDYVDYFCTFMERCYSDWYNEEYLSTLTDMIIDVIIEMNDEFVAFQYSRVLFTITYSIDDYTVNLNYAEKIDKLLKKYQTEIIALAYAAALCNVSGRADNYDKGLQQANKINELLKYYKTPEIALVYALALGNVSNKADNYEQSLKQANKINELLKYYKTPEIALKYAKALFNATCVTDNFDERLEQADKINELLKEYKTPEIALEYAKVLGNATFDTDNFDESVKQTDKIKALLKEYKTHEIALAYAKSLVNTALNSDSCNIIISYKTEIYNLYQEYKTLEFAEFYSGILAVLSDYLDTADEIKNICLAGIEEIKADGFNSEEIEEMEKIINDNLSKKLKDNL